MKKSSIILSCILVASYIVLSSDIDGAAHHGHGDLTGAPSGATGHCQTSTCHGGNNAQTVVALQVSDTATLLPVTTYTAGHTYLVTLTGDATAVATNLPGCGFQVSAVMGTHALAGSYTIPTSLSGSIHTTACGATTVVEHNALIPQTTSGVNKYTTQFYWTAPASFSDSVTFYAVLNAVNNNADKSGDYPNAAPRVTIHENAADGVTEINGANEISFYPNPATSMLTIQAKSVINSVIITDISGHKELQQSYHSTNAKVDISALAAGVYFINLNGTEAKKFVKQ